MRILVVEDEHKIANSIKKGLEQEAFAVDLAYDGTTGYDLASTENYDVIILDLMLPGMDGTMICKKLREENNHTPILMLTAKGEVEDKVAGLNAGADDYLPKPFAFLELLARIRALSRRPKNTVDNVLKTKNISLNTTNFEVTYKTKKLAFSRKEFSLLEYLLRNKNKVVSKEQIMNGVWDYDSDVLPNTVEVYVGYLRKKMPGEIKTLRGFGYKIEE